MDDLRTEQDLQALLEARQMLNEAQFPSISGVLIASNAGIAVQALLTGSCLQMARMYYRTRKDDPPLAKIGIAWIICVLMLCFVLSSLQQSMVMTFAERFTAFQYQDFWIYQLQILLNNTVYAPTLLFFVRRAYYIWDRNRMVYIIGIGLVFVSFVMNLTACAVGLRTPAGGFAPISNEQYVAAIPAFVEMMDLFTIVSESVQVATTTSLCIAICWGIARHRNGFRAFDTAISRVAFVCGESLIPMVALNLTSLILFAIPPVSVPIMLLRPLVSLTPAVFAHALLTALTSRERVRDILSAEPVRELAPFSTSPLADAEKTDEESGNKSQTPPPVAILSTLHDSDKHRRRRGWASRRARSEDRAGGLAITLDSPAGDRQWRSQMSAPLSPGGGASSALTSGLVRLEDGERVASPPSSPGYVPPGNEDPLIRNGAIVRPPVSPRSPTIALALSLDRHRLPSSPGMGQTELLEAWSPARHAAGPSTVAGVEQDDGVDIFDVLFNGPAPGRSK